MTIKQVIWVLRYEPIRVWQWSNRHSPLTGKKYGLLEGIRATAENPPCFDISWDIDMENSTKYDKEEKLYEEISNTH